MGREVRMVPPTWEHPKCENSRNSKGFRPLFEGDRYTSNVAAFLNLTSAEQLQEAIDFHGRAPDKNDYMPVWTADEATHYMMYEDTSEGTPISPAFATPEELAQWLADTKASAFTGIPASYESWLSTIKRGFAFSAVSGPNGVQSGVEGMADMEATS